MFEDIDESKDDDLPELSEEYKLELEDSWGLNIFKRSIMGEVDVPCLSAGLDGSDQYVAAWYSNGEIKIFDPHGGGLLKRLQKDSESSGLPATTVIKWKPHLDSKDSENLLLAGDNNGNITKYDVTDGMVVDQITWKGEEENKIYAIDYTKNGRNFATAGYDGIVRIYDDITMKLVQESDPFKSGHGGHSNRVFAVKFSKEDPNILVSGGWDNNIIIHDRREKGPVNAIIGAYICGDALDICGDKILSGSNRIDKQLQLWSLETTKLIQTIDWNGDGIFKGREKWRIFWTKFMVHSDSGKEYILAGGGITNELRIFNNELKPIANIGNFSRGCFSCDNSNTGDSFLCAGGDGVVRLFKAIFQ